MMSVIFIDTEEAVQEVRRQAMLELEKAVTAAESRASQMIALERSKLETLILEAKRQAQQEVLTRLNKHHHQSPEPPGSNDAMLVCRNPLILYDLQLQSYLNTRAHRDVFVCYQADEACYY